MISAQRQYLRGRRDALLRVPGREEARRSVYRCGVHHLLYAERS